MIDRAIIGFDRILRTVFAPAHPARPVPGGDLPEDAVEPGWTLLIEEMLL